jgi:hypothetical protein
MQATAETYGRVDDAGLLPTEPSSPTDGHVLFVPNDDGYELAERDGAAPQVGQTVDVGAEAWIVTKVGRSPLPYDERDCAFLTSAN